MNRATHRALVLLTFLTFGCDTEASDPAVDGTLAPDAAVEDATVPDAAVGADASVEADGAPMELDPVAAAIACEAERFQASPLEGQAMQGGFAFDTETVIVSTTALYLLPGGASRARFGELVGPIIGTLMANSGMLATATTFDDECGIARTLTVWRDRQSMYDFVGSDAHVAAILAHDEVGRPESTVTHWEAPTADFPPTWDEARQEVLLGRAAGR